MKNSFRWRGRGEEQGLGRVAAPSPGGPREGVAGGPLGTAPWVQGLPAVGGHPGTAPVVQLLSRVRLFSTSWTAAHQASLCFTVS